MRNFSSATFFFSPSPKSLTVAPMNTSADGFIMAHKAGRFNLVALENFYRILEKTTAGSPV